METPSGPPEPLGSHDTSLNVRINTIICAAAPLVLSAIIVAACLAVDGGLSDSNVIIGGLVACLIVAVPFVIGFVIALRWRKLHSGYYFLIGLGMSIAAGCVLTALAVGACFGFFALA